MKNSIKSMLVGVLSIILFVFIIVNQSVVSAAVLEAMKRCVYTIIPSLFASSVIASVITKSGIIRWALCRLPINAVIVELFILGNIGGYPIGARLLSEAVRRGDIASESAERAMIFCYSPGPAFCVGVIGHTLFGISSIGLWIYLICLIINLLFLLTYKDLNCKVKRHYRIKLISTREIIDSVNSSAQAMITITAIICIFAVIIAIFNSVLTSVKLKCLTQILDITSITQINLIGIVPSICLVSFGGLCVIFQILGIVGEDFKLRAFIISHLPRFMLALMFGYITEKIIDIMGVETISVSVSENQSIIPIICVIFMLYISISKIKTRP